MTDRKPPISIPEAEDILRSNFAPWVLALDLTVTETGSGGATLVMPSAAKLRRTGGIVSGQALMALADTAMVIALCSAVGEFRAFATINVNTTFLRPATDTGIAAVATVLRLGRTMAFAEARLYAATPDRPIVANVTGSYAVPQPR